MPIEKIESINSFKEFVTSVGGPSKVEIIRKRPLGFWAIGLGRLD